MIHDTIVRIQHFGEFEILFQYVNEEPALVIRASRFLSLRRRAWVITQESAWKYVDVETGDHCEYMVSATHKMGEMLGLGVDLMTRFKIADAIVSSLEELINMKPYKRPKEAVSAEVTGKVTVGGKSFSIDAVIDETVNPIKASG